MTRILGTDDVQRVAEIHVSGWRHAYKGLIPDAYLFKNMSVAKSFERFMDLATNNASTVLVYEDPAEGIIKGFALHSPAADPADAGFHDLVALYVQPEFIRQGIGTSLLRAVEEVQEREFPGTPLIIWALEGNARAIAFYERCGYAQDGTRKYAGFLDAWEVRFSRAGRIT